MNVAEAKVIASRPTSRTGLAVAGALFVLADEVDRLEAQLERAGPQVSADTGVHVVRLKRAWVGWWCEFGCQYPANAEPLPPAATYNADEYEPVPLDWVERPASWRPTRRSAERFARRRARRHARIMREWAREWETVPL